MHFLLIWLNDPFSNLWPEPTATKQLEPTAARYLFVRELQPKCCKALVVGLESRGEQGSCQEDEDTPTSELSSDN